MKVKTVSFESMFEDQFHISPNQAISEFRTEVSPESTFTEYKTEFIFDEQLPADKQEEIFEAFELWTEAADSALNDYQITLSEKYAVRNTTSEIDFTPEFKQDNPNNYRSDKQVVAFMTTHTDGSKVTSRDIWDRTTGWDSSTIVMTEYGIYNPYSNSASAAAMMRVRKVYRNNTTWLTMGSIQINLDNEDYYCGQHNCTFDGNFHDVETIEQMEEAVLILLQHLGTHNPFNAIDYPFPPIKRINPRRDEDDYKVFTHLMKCRNKDCNHGNMVLGDW